MSLVGQEFGGYQIEALLAQKDNTDVYLAHTAGLTGQQQYAIKVLTAKAAQNPTDVARFMREMNVLSELDHPNIIRLEGWGMGEGERLFLVTPYLGGLQTLRQLMSERGFSPKSAWQVVQAIGGALQHLHDAGVVHRNIQPGSIFFQHAESEAEWHLILGEFGANKIPTIDETVTGKMEVLSDPEYTSPDMLQDARQVDHRADLYSFGVVLYQLLLGDLPYLFRSKLQMMAAHSFDPPIPAQQRHPAFPAALDSLLLKLLAKKPDERYQSAQAMVDDYRQALAILPEAAQNTVYSQA